MKISIIDCGVGNIGSIYGALKKNNTSSKYIVKIVQEPNELSECNFLILPGVGSFDGFMGRLERLGLDLAIKLYINNNQGSLLGICVGMQVLFDFGYENKKCKGLGLIPGEVKLIESNDSKLHLPHVGWNNVTFKKDFCKFDGDYYFTHSYCAYTDNKYISGFFEYGKNFTAAVQRGSIIGFQFHPEKSGDLGSRLLTHYIQS